MREMSNREIAEAQQQQRDTHAAIYGEESARKHFPNGNHGPDNEGFGWFNKLAVVVVGVCVIGIGIQSMTKPKGDPVIVDPERDKESDKTVSGKTQLEPSVSQELLPFTPKESRARELENAAMARTQPKRSQSPRIIKSPKKKEPPKFDSTGQLASFSSSMTIDCLQTNDDGTILYAGVNEIVIEYDLSTGQQLREFAGHDGEITSLDVFDQSQKLITGSSDKTAIVWDLESGQQLHRLSENNTVGAVAGSRDGKLVATAALFKNPQVWSVEKGERLSRTNIESWPWNSKINALTFDDEAKYLIGGGTSYNSHIWMVSTGRQKGQIQAHKNQYVLDLALSPDGDSLVMLDASGVKIFSTKRYQEQLSIDFDAPRRMQVTVTDDGSRFVAVDGIYNMEDGRMLSQADIPLRTCRTVTATPDGNRFIYATSRAIEVTGRE